MARSLGEGHWAEQLAVLRKGRLDVLDALGSPKKLALPLNEVLACRFVEGPFPTLVVETVGLCHYLGFADDDRSDAFATALSIARSGPPSSRRTTLVFRRRATRATRSYSNRLRINKRDWS